MHKLAVIHRAWKQGGRGEQRQDCLQSTEKCITNWLLYTVVWGSDTELIAYLLKNSFDSIFQLWKTHFWREEIINQHLFHCSERKGFRNIPRISYLHTHSLPPFKILWIIWNVFLISLKIQSRRRLNSDSEITMPGTLQNDFSLYEMNVKPYQSDRVEQMIPNDTTTCTLFLSAPDVEGHHCNCTIFVFR